MWRKCGNQQSALRDYQDAMKLIEVSQEWGCLRDIYYKRGLFWKSIGKFDAAIGDFNSVLKLDPEDVITLRLRGSVFQVSGKHKVKALNDSSLS